MGWDSHRCGQLDRLPGVIGPGSIPRPYEIPLPNPLPSHRRGIRDTETLGTILVGSDRTNWHRLGHAANPA